MVRMLRRVTLGFGIPLDVPSRLGIFWLRCLSAPAEVQAVLIVLLFRGLFRSFCAPAKVEPILNRLTGGVTLGFRIPFEVPAGFLFWKTNLLCCSPVKVEILNFIGITASWTLLMSCYSELYVSSSLTWRVASSNGGRIIGRHEGSNDC